MKPPSLLSHKLSISSSTNVHYCIRRSFPPPKSPLALRLLNRTSHLQFNLLRLSPTANSNFEVVEAVRFDGPVVDIRTAEDCELVIETCITRTLPPALTLEHGLQSIREAVEELKLNSLVPSSGVLRFQVPVPPSPKALKWFCCQPETSGVFPQFFLSKETENPSSKSLHLSSTRGVFGIGAAIFFVNSFSHTSQEQRLIRRFLSSDSFDIATYGFMDTKLDMGSSSVEHEAGSFYFVIPEIELDEHEDVSLLSATLAWDDAFFCTFKQAIQSFESSIYQVSYHFLSSRERCYSKCLRATSDKVNPVEAKNFQMVSSSTLLLGREGYQDDFLELVSPFS